ncbi:MAG: DUF177 domain-containing protein [Magnetococcales bacterium]|nr:DUF177 domain-containing protein [Magnetococcales bacterium]
MTDTHDIAENNLPDGSAADDAALRAQEKQNLSEAGIDLEGVRRLFKQFRGFVATAQLTGLSSEVKPEAEADVALTATFNERLLRVQGEVVCQVQRACARCLTDFSTRLLAEVDRLFVPGPDPAEPDSQQEMVAELTYLPGYRLAIAAVVEEELLLALPMIPLCHPECLGLCPQCGVDLNKEKCLCVETATEGPFAVLKNLK